MNCHNKYIKRVAWAWIFIDFLLESKSDPYVPKKVFNFIFLGGGKQGEKFLFLLLYWDIDFKKI